MKHKPLERNPVILSLILLKALGVEEKDHSKFVDQWSLLWICLMRYRDSKKPEQWTTRILDGILSGQATFDSGPDWVALNEVLNTIWERTNEGS